MQTISEADIREAIKRPSDFGYYGDLPIGTTWSLGPMILNRDSGPLEQSNAAVVKKVFAELFGEGGEDNGWEVTRCNHWAVGWVEHLGDSVNLFCRVEGVEHPIAMRQPACSPDASRSAMMPSTSAAIRSTISRVRDGSCSTGSSRSPWPGRSTAQVAMPARASRR